MNVREILKIKLNKNENETLQKRAFKLLIYFLILMIIFTFLSRFAASLLVPIVTTEKTKSMSIDHTITADGIIESNSEIAIDTLSDITVTEVDVSEGSEVQVGDILFKLNLDEINKQLEDINTQISDNSLTLSRAKEDYNYAVSQQDELITEAKSEVDKAQSAINNYNSLSDEEKAEYGDYQSLVENYNAAQTTYNNAVNNKEENLLTYERAIEDAQTIVDRYISETEEQIEQLQTLVSSQGNVISDKKGVVTTINIAVGDMTTTAPLLYLADDESSYKFTAEISKDYKDYIQIGQIVTVELSNNENIENATISSITENEEDTTMYDVIVILPSGTGIIGESASLQISSDTKKYDTCISIAALHEENNQYYVLVVSEENSILGTIEVAEKIYVNIEDKNDSYVALIDGVLAYDDEIITESNKTIDDGDRVRLEE